VSNTFTLTATDALKSLQPSLCVSIRQHLRAHIYQSLCVLAFSPMWMNTSTWSMIWTCNIRQTTICPLTHLILLYVGEWGLRNDQKWSLVPGALWSGSTKQNRCRTNSHCELWKKAVIHLEASNDLTTLSDETVKKLCKIDIYAYNRYMEKKERWMDHSN